MSNLPENIHTPSEGTTMANERRVEGLKLQHPDALKAVKMGDALTVANIQKNLPNVAELLPKSAVEITVTREGQTTNELLAASMYEKPYARLTDDQKALILTLEMILDQQLGAQLRGSTNATDRAANTASWVEVGDKISVDFNTGKCTVQRKGPSSVWMEKSGTLTLDLLDIQGDRIDQSSKNARLQLIGDMRERGLLVKALDDLGQDSSFVARKRLITTDSALRNAANGYLKEWKKAPLKADASNYSGTAEQNHAVLYALLDGLEAATQAKPDVVSADDKTWEEILEEPLPSSKRVDFIMPAEEEADDEFPVGKKDLKANDSKESTELSRDFGPIEVAIRNKVQDEYKGAVTVEVSADTGLNAPEGSYKVTVRREKDKDYENIYFIPKKDTSFTAGIRATHNSRETTAFGVFNLKADGTRIPVLGSDRPSQSYDETTNANLEATPQSDIPSQAAQFVVDVIGTWLPEKPVKEKKIDDKDKKPADSKESTELSRDFGPIEVAIRNKVQDEYKGAVTVEVSADTGLNAPEGSYKVTVRRGKDKDYENIYFIPKKDTSFTAGIRATHNSRETTAFGVFNLKADGTRIPVLGSDRPSQSYDETTNANLEATPQSDIPSQAAQFVVDVIGTWLPEKPVKEKKEKDVEPIDDLSSKLDRLSRRDREQMTLIPIMEGQGQWTNARGEMTPEASKAFEALAQLQAGKIRPGDLSSILPVGNYRLSFPGENGSVQIDLSVRVPEGKKDASVTLLADNAEYSSSRFNGGTN